MPRRYHRSYSDSDSKNAQGMIVFGLSLTFLTFLVVSMVTFAVHVKQEMEDATQEPEIPDNARVNWTLNDSYADANHTVDSGHTRHGVVTTVVAETTSTAARRRNMRRRGHDFPVPPPERRKPREHAEKKPANVPQVDDHDAKTTHRVETAPPTTTTPTTTTTESATTAPTTTSSTAATKTSTTTQTATTPATTMPAARTPTTTPSTSTTTTPPTSSESSMTPTTKTTVGATPETSSTIRRTRAIIKALTVERFTSPTKPTTPRRTRKIIAAKEVVPGSDAKSIRAEDGGDAVMSLVMEAPMVNPAFDIGRPPATPVGSFRRSETGSSVKATAGLESSRPEATLAKISPSNETAISPKGDSAFTSLREPRTSHPPPPL